MPLILAIEPDRRQASQLKKLVHSVGAELVLADTTERALDAIGNRIPDLVLVPALLSPQDDAALATALRVIATAAHVQTLTIPVFAAPTSRPRKSGGGVLAKLMGDRPQDAAPDGCNPGLFAEQIAAYLAEAETARAHKQYAEEYQSPAPRPIVEPPAAAASSASSFDVEPWLDEPAAEMSGLSVVHEPMQEPVYTPAYETYVPASEPVYEHAPEPTPEPVAADEPEPVVRSFERKPLHIVHPAPELIEDAEPEWQPVVESEPEPEPVQATADARPDAQTVVEFDPSDIDLGAFIAELEEQRRAASAEENKENDDRPVAAAAAIEEEFEPAPDAIEELDSWMTPPLAPQRPWPHLEAATAGATRRPDQRSDSESEAESDARVEEPEMTVVAEIEPAPSDWIDMLEALRRDIDRLRGERTAAPLPAAAAAPEPSEADAEQASSRKKKRKKEPPPVQDEWGFFDPEQCGFTALLAKLDEISKNDDGGGKRSP
jgi:hypothetical protein